MTAQFAGEVSKNGSSPTKSQPIPGCAIPAGDESDPTGTEVCPYPGLAFFRPSEARWFFGREETTKAVISRLGALLAGGVPLAVMAPSGAGKSSLLAAGVIPALAGGGLSGSQDWPVVNISPGAHPLASLSVRVAERIGADPSEVTAATANPEQFTAFLVTHIGKQRDTYGYARIVLVVDQFEEVFTECQQEHERQAFIAALCAGAHSGMMLVLLGVRADFYGSCLKYPELVTSLQSPVALGPMSTDQLRSIITGPAEAENLEIEPGLVELLMGDLELAHDPSVAAAGYNPGTLPLLAHALRMTWQKRSGRLLTVAGYRRTGGIREAITTTAESAYTQLAPFEQRIAEQLLLRLVNVSEHSRTLRRRVPRERLLRGLRAPAETSEQVLETFRRARLLTLDIISVEITHEALLWAWPRLAEWINADHPGLRVRQMLSEATEAWENENRDSSMLCRGPRLVMAQDWVAAPGCKEQLSELEVSYLQSSIDYAQREQQAQQRHTRHLRVLIGVLAVALVMAILAAGVAVTSYKQAENAKKDAVSAGKNATSGEIAANSYPIAAAHPEVAMLRAVEAFRMSDNLTTRSALFSAQSAYFVGRFSGHKGPLNRAIFSPDGKSLVTTSGDGTVLLWNTADRRQVGKLIYSSNHPVYGADFNPDGTVLATIRVDGSMQLWDSAGRQIDDSINTLDGLDPSVLQAVSVKFSHDGQTLSIAYNNYNNEVGRDQGRTGIQLWNVASRQRITSFSLSVGKIVLSPASPIGTTTDRTGRVSLISLVDPANPVFLANLPQLLAPSSRSDFSSTSVFSPDGATLVTATSDRTAILWDVRDPHNPKPQGEPLAGHTNVIKSMAFSPDGGTLVTGSEDGTARLWNVATQKEIATFGGPNGPAISDVSFNRDGHTVVTAHGDGIARLWDIRAPILVPGVPLKDPDPSLKVKFSPDRKMLATYGFSGLRVWDMIEQNQISELSLNQPVTDLSFSEDGLTMTVARRDDSVILWNKVKSDHIISLPVRAGRFGKVALSPNGKILAIAGEDDNDLQFWSIEKSAGQLWISGKLSKLTSQEIQNSPLRHFAGGLFKKMAFSSNAHILAIATMDGAITLYNVRDPRHPVPFHEPLDNRSLPAKDADSSSASIIKKISFVSDDRILVVAKGERNGSVERWDVEKNHLLSSSPINSDLPYAGNTSSLVGLSSDGVRLASIEEDATKIKLWNLDKLGNLSGAQLPRQESLVATLTGHIDRISDADYNRDNFLATVSSDGTVRIWDLNPIRVSKRLCHIIGPISGDERKKFLSPVLGKSEIPNKPACQQ